MTIIPCVVDCWFQDIKPVSGYSNVRCHAKSDAGVPVEIIIYDIQFEAERVWDGLKNYFGLNPTSLPEYYTRLHRQMESLDGKEKGLFHCWFDKVRKEKRFSFEVRSHRVAIEKIISFQPLESTATLFQFDIPYFFDEAILNFGHAIILDYSISQKVSAKSTW